jgi:NAD(P) transhydrogenase subunit alpha
MTMASNRGAIERSVADADLVIGAVLVAGGRAPVVVSDDLVRGMKAGAVIVDVAAETGGNCELTKPGETVEAHGVTILGPLNLPSTAAVHASQMFSRNVSTLLQHLVKDGEIRIDVGDEITSAMAVTHDGELRI